MAGAAVHAGEHGLAGARRAGQRAARGPIGRVVERGERGDVGRQRIEVGAAPGLRIAQRLAARAGVEIGVGHQARAQRQRADLAFEVLQLVEVVAPVQEPLARRAPAQADRVAQAFAEAGQVPHPAVAAAVVVAGGAAHVAVARQARVARVVEELLAFEHRRAQLLGAHGRQGGERRHVDRARAQQRRQVEHADGAVHEVVDVQPLAVGGQRQRLRRAADVEAEQLVAAVRADHRHFAAGLERDEQVDAALVEDRRARHAGVVVVDACRVVLGAGGAARCAS